MLDCGHANLFLELHTRMNQDKPTWVQFKFYDLKLDLGSWDAHPGDGCRTPGRSKHSTYFWAKHAWMVSSMPLILCHHLGKVYAQFLTKCRETKIGHRLNPAIEADASGQER